MRCARVQRDDVLGVEIERVWQANLQVYGADKVWRVLRREGAEMARCTVERLMRKAGLRGVIRGKDVRTTVADAKALRSFDGGNRSSRHSDRTSCGREAVELATLEWVSCLITIACSNQSAIYISPAEAEANYYKQLSSQAIPP